MPLVTINALAKAIQKKLDINGEEARRYAGIVMDLFGYDDCIIDNMLDHQDRRLFYKLESQGILNTRREDTLLYDGKNWRIHYWTLQKHAIFPSVIEKKERNTRKKNKSAVSYNRRNVYSSLPAKAWATRKNLFV
jgi:hypothetical protein